MAVLFNLLLIIYYYCYFKYIVHLFRRATEPIRGCVVCANGLGDIVYVATDIQTNMHKQSTNSKQQQKQQATTSSNTIINNKMVPIVYNFVILIIELIFKMIITE